MKLYVYVALFTSGLLTGCMRDSSGPDAACTWPAESERPLNLRIDRDAQHLSEDAEKAEDISIRYGDGHSRPTNAGWPTIADYRRTRAVCLASLFDSIAQRHHVAAVEVRASIGAHRSKTLDGLVVVSFAVLYILLVNRFVRGLWLRYPPAQDRNLGVAATVAVSPIASLLGLALGGFWSWYTETLRIGYGHLVERYERIPWFHHQTDIFVLGILMFWVLSWIQYHGAALQPQKRDVVYELKSSLR